MQTVDGSKIDGGSVVPYRVAASLGALSAICFSVSFLLAPMNLNVIADICRHATFAFLAGGVTALIYEWRGVHDTTCVAQSTANQISS